MPTTAATATRQNKKAKELDVPTLFVGRHGSTKWNTGDPDTDRAKGQTDLPLTEEGQREAEQLARFLAGYKLAEVHHGALKRTSDTARRIAIRTGAKQVQDSPLPWDIGYLAGQLRREIADRINYYISNDKRAIPDGEPYGDMWDRTTEHTAKLLKRAEEVHRNDNSALAWVANSDSIVATEAFITGDEPEAVEAGSGPPPGSVMQLAKRGGKWRLSYINNEGEADEE